MLAPYNDPFYTSRRPTLAIPAGQVLQIGTDSSNVALGLHPRLTGLKQIFDQGRLAFIQRTGYENQSRSHFTGTDIWSTADPNNSQGLGWVGRYLDSLPSPVDPLVGWNTTRNAAARAAGAHRGAGDRQPGELRVLEPEHRRRSDRRAIHGGAHRVARAGRSAASSRSSTAARRRRWRRSIASRPWRSYKPSPAYPNTGFAQALQAVAGAMTKSIGTRVFYVTTGGFDTHSAQNVNATNGAYYNLMATLNDGLLAFYNDLKSAGPARRHAGPQLLGVRPPHQRERQPAAPTTASASVMMAMGGQVQRRPLRHRAEPQHRSGEPDAREQRRRRQVRDRLPLGLRAGARQLAGHRLGASCSAATSARTASASSRVSLSRSALSLSPPDL